MSPYAPACRRHLGACPACAQLDINWLDDALKIRKIFARSMTLERSRPWHSLEGAEPSHGCRSRAWYGCKGSLLMRISGLSTRAYMRTMPLPTELKLHSKLWLSATAMKTGEAEDIRHKGGLFRWIEHPQLVVVCPVCTQGQESYPQRAQALQ